MSECKEAAMDAEAKPSSSQATTYCECVADEIKERWTYGEYADDIEAANDELNSDCVFGSCSQKAGVD